MGLQQAAERGGSPYLHFMRASGLAQARLQVAVLAGNRRRALEQIDRLVAIDKQLERAAEGEEPIMADDLAGERLALASEKLVLTSAIALPRLDPAFGAGMPVGIAPDEPLLLVGEGSVRNRLIVTIALCVGFFALCAGLGALVLNQL